MPLRTKCCGCGADSTFGECDCTRQRALCLCGNYRTQEHSCAYTRGAGWCPKCLADPGDPSCCTPARLARIATNVRYKRCGCLVVDDCGCGEPVDYPAVLVGAATYGRADRWVS